jgi:hypothetical protein
MIQFLKPRSSRRRSQRHLDVLEPAPMPLPDVTDWLADNAELAGLTDEEAAEIQFAFQHQVDDMVADPLMLAPASVEVPLALAAAVPMAADAPLGLASELAIDAAAPVEILADPLDLTQVESLEPLLMLVPELVSTPPLVDADALVEFRLETCSSGLSIVPPLVEQVAIDPEPALTEAIVVEPAADADQAIAIDGLVADELVADELVADELVEPVVEAPIDWANANWASEAVDVAALEATASEAEAATTGPLTYFQYYLDENAIDGQGAADEVPAAYVTPWRQPSMPRGLIGAGVLGATLVSGFVIADTVKTPPVTAVKRPTSPLQSLSPKDQALTTAALPQVMPPESMQPEVALPKPKSMAMMPPGFSPLAPIGQSMPISPLGTAIARNEASTALPQSQSNPTAGNLNLDAPSPIARSEAPAAGPKFEPAPVIEQSVPTQLPQPMVLRNTPPAEVPATFTPTSSPQDLPELTPDTTMPQVQETAPTSKIAPTPLAELTPESVSSPLQRVPAESPNSTAAVPSVDAPPVDVVVPTQPVTPTAIAPVEVAAPVKALAPTVEQATDQSAAIVPADRVFTRAVAPSVLSDQTAAATPMPPVAAAQPIADRSTRLPPQVQNLLARPAVVNAYVPMVAGWRPLLQEEAAVALKAPPQLDGYTRQQLSQQAYVQAYQAVSQSADGVPSFGFIDYQRKLIILPPLPETAVNPTIEHSRSAYGQAIIAQRTMSL